MEPSRNEVSELIDKHAKLHYSTGPIHQNIERIKARDCMESNELQAIYHLVESHVPSFRLKSVLRYEKCLTSELSKQKNTLSKNYVSLVCKSSIVDENVNKMLERVKEMPPEWTLVQLTPHFNVKENLKTNIKNHYTNVLYITVFNCGENQPKPFCVEIKSPTDQDKGCLASLKREIDSIVGDNVKVLKAVPKQAYFKGVVEKRGYYEKRGAIDDRLKWLVKELQDFYLKEWRCLLVGKFVDNSLEIKLENHIKQGFKTELPSLDLDEKTLCIFKYLVKSSGHLKLNELKKIIQTVVPKAKSTLIKTVAQLIHDIRNEYYTQKTHPLILILDDSLDCFPWEMMDIFTDKSVTRLPSLHLAYALFQEHKDSIKSGFKIVENPHKGTYIINPDLDLKSMENRILSFYNYWLPDWKGVAGRKPTQDEFEELLLSGTIFAYNGHGGGIHLLTLNKVEKMRINAVILLFGCSSIRTASIGPQTEMYGAHQMYFIACSPCIVGNLWEVTDLDTDILATEILSQWIPNSDTNHWKNLDKSKWKKGEKVQYSRDDSLISDLYEPELLKVISTAKKTNNVIFYITKAALVVRGIPVKMAN